MPDGAIPYASLVEQALMGVVRGVLADAARVGLETPHHFYITFRTDHPGVEIPPELHQRYRQEMTIVLQHQFWDLVVGDDRFDVTLSFSGRPQRLSIPFAAVKVFADPGVEFGLQFTLADAEAPETEAPVDERAPAPVFAVAQPADEATSGTEDAAAGRERNHAGADIVTLDRFRKR